MYRQDVKNGLATWPASCTALIGVCQKDVRALCGHRLGTKVAFTIAERCRFEAFAVQRKENACRLSSIPPLHCFLNIGALQEMVSENDSSLWNGSGGNTFPIFCLYDSVERIMPPHLHNCASEWLTLHVRIRKWPRFCSWNAEKHSATAHQGKSTRGFWPLFATLWCQQ